MESQPDEKLTALIEGMVNSVQTDTKSERANQIQQAVIFHLKTWLDKVESLNPLYKVSELIQVGSYAEGTKIIHPDEFDFLAVIEDLSQPGAVVIDKSTSDLKSGLVKVAVADDRLKSRCDKLCKNGHLQCFQPINFPQKYEYRFGHVFISLLWSIVRKGKRIGPTFGSPTDIDCKIQLPTVNNSPLYLIGADYKAPNVLIKFELKNREVTVDLSPAIRYHQIEDCFKAENCVGPAFAELVLCRKSLLLIGTGREFDFKVTVTEAEVQYIQSVMKPEHKVIYIFLKYIEKLYEDHLNPVKSFSSYMLKTLCIHHDIKCTSEERTIAKCLKSLIEDLDVCTRQNYVISAVNRHIHLFFKVLDELTTISRQTMLDGMRKLWQLPNEVNTVNEFDAFLMFLIQQESQRRDEEKRLLQQEWDRSNRSAVSQYIDMGFEPEEVHKAMRASFNEPGLALEYLKEGIPEHLQNLKGFQTAGQLCNTSYGQFFTLEPTSFEWTDNTAQTMHVGECSQSPTGGLTSLVPTFSAQTRDSVTSFEQTDNKAYTIYVGENRQAATCGLIRLVPSFSAPTRDPVQAAHVEQSRQGFSSELSETELNLSKPSTVNADTSQLGQGIDLSQNYPRGQDVVTYEILYQRQKDL